ncbi:MAG: hypothetical protein N3E51_03535 [Candidatus Micrarchaeota archaeon]|nr:hypothetical protein [Candidatus Micrarchaeota archaeon]
MASQKFANGKPNVFLTKKEQRQVNEFCKNFHPANKKDKNCLASHDSDCRFKMENGNGASCAKRKPPIIEQIIRKFHP